MLKTLYPYIEGYSQGDFLRQCRLPLSLREAAPVYGVHYNTLLAWEKETKQLPENKIETARTLARVISVWQLHK